MSLIVTKFGGTSLCDLERVQAAARKVVDCRHEGHEVIVVVSAMAGETDKLEDLGYSISTRPNPREMDVLLASGEQVSIALIAMAIQDLGVPAMSYLGNQVPVYTNECHQRARITEVGCKELRRSIEQGAIPVVAGFQGIAPTGEITTIGRGGSDTTAVAIAVAMEASECRIYTDVDGVYTADPRIVEQARRMDSVTFEEMLELAALGAKVLHLRSVEYARRYSIPLKVFSSFIDGPGTLIVEEGESMEQPEVSAITFDKNEAKVTITHVPDIPGIAYQLLGPVGDANISVDMIVQNVSRNQRTDLTFTVPRSNFEQSLEILRDQVIRLRSEAEDPTLYDMEVVGDDAIAKVTAVGLGIRSHAGIATKMFETLAQYGINIQMISTSEIKISVVIHEDFCELAVRMLHSAFDLGTD
ncbi:MAG: aspartate kinase [Gammaproteobacteria bacterium]|nr:aspartate kinase [Gammaproteobacteria bacterium]MXW07514.1 aspartate kinase [Gammaproteobacteria bacterium]MYC24763.1 aspartate kinase [Gammaproteobacteria bacterium]